MLIVYHSFFSCCYYRVYSPAQPIKGFALSDLLDKLWSQVPSLSPSPVLALVLIANRFRPSHFSLFMLVDCHRILLAHALARSARHLLARKVPRSTSMHSVRLEPTTFDFSRDNIHLLLRLHRGRRLFLRRSFVSRTNLITKKNKACTLLSQALLRVAKTKTKACTLLGRALLRADCDGVALRGLQTRQQHVCRLNKLKNTNGGVFSFHLLVLDFMLLTADLRHIASNPNPD